MKQMRSRFRLLTFLLACAFLLTLILCAGSVLRSAGITLASLSSLPPVSGTSAPDSSVSPELSPGAETISAPEETPAGSSLPGTDISPEPEYNVFGL